MASIAGEQKITVRILDPEKGLREINDVIAVRILSNDYRILIMQDYLPTIGEVRGKVIVVLEDEEIKLEDLHAFYKSQNNIFYLMVDRFN